MLRNFLVVVLYFLWGDFKTWLSKVRDRLSDIFFIHVWHRRHVFIFDDIHPDEMDKAVCLFCPKTLDLVKIHRDSLKIISLVFLLCALTHADHFVGGKTDSTFYHDSTYTFQLVLSQTHCGGDSVCAVNIGDGIGPGHWFRDLKGNPGDTIKIKYAFPLADLKQDYARMAFYSPDGNVYLAWSLKLAFRPSAILWRGKPKRSGKAPSWPLSGRYAVNGRVWP